MKKKISAIIILVLGLNISAQVGINTTSPTSGIALDVNGNTRVKTTPITTNTGLTGTDLLLVRTSTGELKKQKLSYRSTSYKNVTYIPQSPPINVPQNNFNTLYFIMSNNTFSVQSGDNLYEDVSVTNMMTNFRYTPFSQTMIMQNNVVVRLMNADTNTLVEEQEHLSITYDGANLTKNLEAKLTFVQTNLPAGNYRYDLYIRKVAPQFVNTDYDIDCSNVKLISYQKITNLIHL